MRAQDNNTRRLPDFEKPPINEVVAGVYFERLEGFKLPHFGRYWDRIKKRYPHCEHAVPLATPAKDDELPWPRVWLLNESKTNLVQLQRTCLLCNWRRVAGNEEYPRYAHLIREFLAQLEEFREFLTDQSISPPQMLHCELTYINHIPAGEIWQTAADVGKFAPDFSWRKQERFLPVPKSSTWTGIFDLPDDFGKLILNVKYATRRSDGSSLYIIEISTKGLGGDGSDKRIREWFEVAHE